MKHTNEKRIGRIRRHNRIRSTMAGTSERPRLSVYKSNRYLHAQIIDDEAGKTIVAGSTKEQKQKDGTAKIGAAQWLGGELAKRAKEKGVTAVVFDRGGFRYAGRVAALAEAARKGGLQF